MSPSSSSRGVPPDGRPSAESYKSPRLSCRPTLSSLFLFYPSAPPFQSLDIITTCLDKSHHILLSLKKTPPCAHYPFELYYLVTMATHHYQSPVLPMNVPSKTPGPANLYPISRVSGSPPDLSDASTTTGSRTSAGFSYSTGSAGGDYESSTGSFSSVDVVDVLNDRLQNAFDPTPLDKGLAMQAQA